MNGEAPGQSASGLTRFHCINNIQQFHQHMKCTKEIERLYENGHILCSDNCLPTCRYVVVSDLLANIGGQGGLWLGVSVVACCELIELLIDFIVLTLGRLASMRKRRPVSPMIPLQ
ncbi:hypothetical protein LSAT2_008413, partial [Lamellibrachia satsuma]